MTANDMRNLAKELYDGASSVEMGYDDVEISRILNTAKTLELEKRLFGDNPVRTGFEVGSKRDKELSELKTQIMYYRNFDGTYTKETEVGKEDYTIKEDLFDNAFILELPDDFMYYARDFAEIKTHKDLIKKVQIESTNEDLLSEELNNIFTKPSRFKILRTSLSTDKNINPNKTKRVKLFIPNDSVLYKYTLVYIRRPVDIVVDILIPENQVNSDLDESMHLPIVKTAVQIMLGGIGSQKYQIAINENKNNF